MTHKHIPELYQYNLKSIFIYFFSAGILLASWCFCGEQCCTFKNDHSLRVSIWNRIDLLTFRFLNQWLITYDSTRIIAKLFVVLNSMFIGEIITNLTIIFLIYFIFSSKHILQHQKRSMKIAIVFAMIIYGMAGQMFLSKISRDFLCPKRPSPSVVFRFSTVNLENEAIRSTSETWTIERLFEEAKKRDLVKEIAYDSWPGEHAAVNLIWSLFMSTIINRSSSFSFSRTKRFLMHFIVWFFAILFSLARLISGAHWLSDCLVGGLAEALIIVALGVYTPMLEVVAKVFHRCFHRSSNEMKKLP